MPASFRLAFFWPLQIEYQAMYDKLPDLSSEELAKLKWWSDIEPSRLKSGKGDELDKSTQSGRI